MGASEGAWKILVGVANLSIFCSLILIGPNDWEDHASGKEGVERYRIHNLPNSSSCPGLYELGVASFPSVTGHRSRKLDVEDIIVVYLGQADNIRTRLQEYGRSGSHLDQVNLSICNKNNGNSTEGGPGLFKDIFSRSYSIMFRWAPIKNKREAEKTEIQLLYIFDYAWNRRENGKCRHADILPMLNHNSRNSVRSALTRLLHWKDEAFRKRAGINIDAVISPFKEETPPSGLKGYLLPGILKVSPSQLRFLPGDDKSVADHIICGVATGHGSICLNRPVPGRRRCAEHKGKKITGVGSASRRMSGEVLVVDGSKKPEFNHDEEKNSICGVIKMDGCVCRRRPAMGRKRCEEHKGKRLSAGICGVVSDNGYACSRIPVSGKKRCEEHKGMRMVAANRIASR
ncbi:hypothetical protein KSP40_PGU022085 [Platanthera guangdongensis]|uniref:GIY-YIG homing endonuclease n=1 Tax=Platanthera guangdongensis TaxID=2320717 RepID=A0ABR2MRH1_9ASPA